MPAVCPEACGCDPNSTWTQYHSRVQQFCPHSCKAGTPLCFTSVRSYSSNYSSDDGPFPGYACVLPFQYKAQTYTSCTSTDWEVPWCAIAVDASGDNALG